MHDGSLVGSQHLYMYTRQPDGSWWKIQEHEVTKVSATSHSSQEG